MKLVQIGTARLKDGTPVILVSAPNGKIFPLAQRKPKS
jgi:hypothetical protein